ncbi:MAG: GNAT family N-acetyltransferase [Gemmobacter sp.]
MTVIALTDPALPAAHAALAAYFAELDARFPGGFDPGPPADPALYRPPQGAFLLAMADAPMGCVALTRDGPVRGEVKRLWVAPAARGQGLARHLMQAVEAEAQRMGLTHLRLDTNATLTEAVALYTRLGWTPVARYNDNSYAHHWFARTLA